jgi:hypothetical protein
LGDIAVSAADEEAQAAADAAGEEDVSGNDGEGQDQAVEEDEIQYE